MSANVISGIANLCGGALGLIIMGFALWDSRRQQKEHADRIARMEAARIARMEADSAYWEDMCRQCETVEDVVWMEVGEE